VLPPPRVQTVALDQERTTLVALWQTGLWALVPGGEEAQAAAVNRAYRDAQRRLFELAASPELSAAARRQAEKVLGVFVRQLGWDVRVRWAGTSPHGGRSDGKSRRTARHRALSLALGATAWRNASR
jgi:hypothetical protein